MNGVRLREWRAEDRATFAAMNADPQIMRHFLAPMTRTESDAWPDRVTANLQCDGWSVWAVDVQGVLAGLTELAFPRRSLPFTPCTEILWRRRPQFWGRGSGSVQEALRIGFVRSQSPAAQALLYARKNAGAFFWPALLFRFGMGQKKSTRAYPTTFTSRS
jgi:hypothetical protein